MGQPKHLFGQSLTKHRVSPGGPPLGRVVYGSISRGLVQLYTYGKGLPEHARCGSQEKLGCLWRVRGKSLCSLCYAHLLTPICGCFSARWALRVHSLRHSPTWALWSEVTRSRPHGLMAWLCPGKANTAICTLDSSLIMYISNMLESAQVPSAPLLSSTRPRSLADHNPPLQRSPFLLCQGLSPTAYSKACGPAP